MWDNGKIKEWVTVGSAGEKQRWQTLGWVGQRRVKSKDIACSTVALSHKKTSRQHRLELRADVLKLGCWQDTRVEVPGKGMTWGNGTQKGRRNIRIESEKQTPWWQLWRLCPDLGKCLLREVGTFALCGHLAMFGYISGCYNRGWPSATSI